jgi:hypothetical protein
MNAIENETWQLEDRWLVPNLLVLSFLTAWFAFSFLLRHFRVFGGLVWCFEAGCGGPSLSIRVRFFCPRRTRSWKSWTG